ncbi:MAG: hypothetical protein LBL73_08535, partial [Synergistaceae bacterium]|nr:hypothetical protein [Synergistaceae bacterium]
PDRLTNPTVADRALALIALGRRGIADEGERLTLVIVKRMLSGMFKDYYGAAYVRNACATCRGWESMEGILSGLAEGN